MPWRDLRAGIVLAVALDTLLAAGLVATDSGGLLRAATVFVFFLLGPGLAVTGLLRLHDPAAEFAIAIPLSLALNTAVAGGMSVFVAWRPDTALLASALVTVPALALQLRSDGGLRAVFGRNHPSGASAPVPLPQPAPSSVRPATTWPELPPSTRTPPRLPPAAPVRPLGEPAEPPIHRPAAKRPVVPVANGRAVRAPNRAVVPAPNRLPAAAQNRTERAGGDVDDATVPVARPRVNGKTAAAASAGSRRPPSGRPPGPSSPELVVTGMVSLARLEVAADRGALFAPDGGVWTVAAGVNLSAQQRAVRLTAEHLMIREVLAGGRPFRWNATGPRAPDLDELALPLSEHMLALPLTESQSLIILSRSKSPFLAVELQLLNRVLAPKALLLKIALEIREFGEALDHVFD
jgi:hypothetical protein